MEPTQMKARRMLRLPAVESKTGLKRSRIYQLEKIGDFPPRRKLSERAVAWDENEIDDWIESRPLARAEPGAA